MRRKVRVKGDQRSLYMTRSQSSSIGLSDHVGAKGKVVLASIDTLRLMIALQCSKTEVM